MFNALNKPDSIARGILYALDHLDESSLNEIAEHRGYSMSRYSGTIRKLLDSRLVAKVETKRSKAVYTLTERGHKAVELIDRMDELQCSLKAVTDV